MAVGVIAVLAARQCAHAFSLTAACDDALVLAPLTQPHAVTGWWRQHCWSLFMLGVLFSHSSQQHQRISGLHQHICAAEVLLQLQSCPVMLLPPALLMRKARQAAATPGRPKLRPLWGQGCRQLGSPVPSTHCNGICMLMRQHTGVVRHSTHSVAVAQTPTYGMVMYKALRWCRADQRAWAGRHTQKSHTYCTCRPAAGVRRQSLRMLPLLLPRDQVRLHSAAPEPLNPRSERLSGCEAASLAGP